MATLLITAAGAAATALAFKAVDKLFDNGSDSREAELRRHDTEEEDIQKNSVKWNQRRISQQDFERKRRRQAAAASKDLARGTSSMRAYYNATRPHHIVATAAPVAGQEENPSLSSEMEFIGITLGLLGTGYAVYKYKRSL